jgi:hypothetical protein
MVPHQIDLLRARCPEVILNAFDEAWSENTPKRSLRWPPTFGLNRER